MRINYSNGEKTFNIINNILMFMVMTVTLYPLLYVAFASISKPDLIVQHTGLLLWPLGFTSDAYKLVFSNPMIPQGYLNTLFYVFAGTALNLVMTIMAAFVLSRKKFMIRNVMMMVIVFTMFFDGGLIPRYLIVNSIGLFNTRWALIFPVAMSTFNMILMRTFFMSLPDSLEESAKIDGASDLTVLLRIILPLSLPIIAVMVLFYGVGHWNAWFNAMIYLRTRDLYPLQLILREILIQSSVQNMMTDLMAGVDREPIGIIIRYATIMVATIPILFVYPFLQKYFVKGVMIGAIKG